MKKQMLSSAIFAFGLFGATEAFAGGEIFDGGVNTGTSANTGAIVMGATIKSFGASAGKWIAEVFAGAGECLRIDVTSEFTDLETVVVAPNGSVFRNDDRAGAADRRPLVKISPTPNNGWYTVSIGQFAGAAVEGNLVVAYGRFNSANPNCSTPTTPTAAQATQIVFPCYAPALIRTPKTILVRFFQAEKVLVERG
jgi:hypothetical protein